MPRGAWWERDRDYVKTHVRRNTRPMRYWGTVIRERSGASKESCGDPHQAGVPFVSKAKYPY